ncbi:MAG: hypothetical protein IJ092_04955, partial [Atopobiaceae bacterium]|nr:hypothetical protein [Atopobiaceae bacterium]
MEDIAQAFVLGGLLILAMLGLGLAAALPGVDRWSKRFFMVFFSLLVPCVGASFAELITYGNPAMMLAERVTAFVGSLLPAILIAMPTLYLLHCCKESFRSSRLLRAVLALLAAYFAMLGIAQSTTLFYYYTPDNQIDYGPWYPISIVPLALIMVLNLAGVINRRDKLSGRLFYAFLAFLVPLSVAILIQIGTPVFFLIGLGITISALAMFAIIVTEQVEQHLRLQQETARQRARIAVLQMRPHFIHNT